MPKGKPPGYLIRDRQGRDLACLLFGAAAWQVRARDQFLGWNEVQRAAALQYLTNNTRFLILPKVPTYCYTSSVLGCQSNSGCCSTDGTDKPAWTFATAA